MFILSGDDAMMEKMAAQEVTVKGSMDKEKKMIKVTSMEAAPRRPPNTRCNGADPSEKSPERSGLFLWR